MERCTNSNRFHFHYCSKNAHNEVLEHWLLDIARVIRWMKIAFEELGLHECVPSQQEKSRKHCTLFDEKTRKILYKELACNRNPHHSHYQRISTKAGIGIWDRQDNYHLQIIWWEKKDSWLARIQLWARGFEFCGHWHIKVYYVAPPA